MPRKVFIPTFPPGKVLNSVAAMVSPGRGSLPTCTTRSALALPTTTSAFLDGDSTEEAIADDDATLRQRGDMICPREVLGRLIMKLLLVLSAMSDAHAHGRLILR